jgi:probable F420-dependent oxidoreductase
MSGGRFVLGLGAQVKGNVEGRYSASWDPPFARMREYVGSLRAIFASFQTGEPLDFRGEHYRFTKLQPFFNPGPLEHPHVPIVLGAVAPRMTMLAGEIADGLITHPTNTPPRYVREVVWPRLRAGAARSGRTLDDFALVLNALVATGPDAAVVAGEREKWRRILAFLYSTPAYWPSLEVLGRRDTGEALRAMTREQRWDRMRDLLDDALLDAVVPAATFAELPRVLRAWYGGVATRITLALPADPVHDAALATAVRALRTGRDAQP